VWRFAAVGILSSAIAAPLLVLFLMFVLALMAGDRKVLIAIGVLASLIALLLIGGSGSFALDALQMKRRVQEAAQTKYMIGSAQALLKLFVQTLSAIVLAVSAFRAARGSQVLGAAEQRASTGLVMGRRPPPAIRAGAPDVPAPAAAPLDD
jgi:hypothetical protein